MKNKNLVSITDFSKEEYLRILELAAEFEKKPRQDILKGYVIATLFFEPSTRTRLSFETAINALGGRVIGFSDSGATSASKGETLHDTIKMVSNYADLIVMRHPLEGSARLASEVSSVPIVNAGDGANQHPSQTLLWRLKLSTNIAFICGVRPNTKSTPRSSVTRRIFSLASSEM